MNYTFKPDYMFTKGIVYAEFFDPATDNLVGFSKYVTDFGLNGSMNSGDVEGGPGNMLVMCIPDTARLAITAKTADSALNNMAITIGSDLAANGVVETSTVVTATGANLTINNAVAPLGGSNGAVAYILTSSGSDKATVEQNSGTAYPVSAAGVITGFTAVSGNSYCVKYFVQNSSALQLGIPALFQPKVVRAHFAVNCYAKKTGSDVMASSLYKIRHYYIPYYFFTNGMQDSVGQTSTGSVDLSGNCLTYEEAVRQLRFSVLRFHRGRVHRQRHEHLRRGRHLLHRSRLRRVCRPRRDDHPAGEVFGRRYPCQYLRYEQGHVRVRCGGHGQVQRRAQQCAVRRCGRQHHRYRERYQYAHQRDLYGHDPRDRYLSMIKPRSGIGSGLSPCFAESA